MKRSHRYFIIYPRLMSNVCPLIAIYELIDQFLLKRLLVIVVFLFKGFEILKKNLTNGNYNGYDKAGFGLLVFKQSLPFFADLDF